MKFSGIGNCHVFIKELSKFNYWLKLLIIYSVENLKLGRGLTFFSTVQKVDYIFFLYLLRAMLLITVCSQDSHAGAFGISVPLQTQLKTVA